MKLKTLLLLCALLPNFMSTDWISYSDVGEDNCVKWFPEPVSFKGDVVNEHKPENFTIIEDLCADRENDTFYISIHDFVIRTLNGGDSGYLDMISIVYQQLPSIRRLTIAIFCIIFAAIIFYFVWILGLHEFFEYLSHNYFDKYRLATAFFPLICTLSILALGASSRNATFHAINGRATLETANDRSFMPIKERLEKKLASISCLFKSGFLSQEVNNNTLVDRYLMMEIGSYMFDLDFRKWVDPGKRFESDCGECYHLIKNLVNDLRRTLVFSELVNKADILKSEYVEIIRNSLNLSIPFFGKTLGSIDEFVNKYLENVLLLPSQRAFIIYNTLLSLKVVLTIAINFILIVLLVFRVEFKKNYSKRIIGMSVPITLFFTITSLLAFIAIMISICFTMVVHEQVQRNDFEIFKKLNPTNFSENGMKYSVNYGNILSKAARQNTTLFHLLIDDNNHLPKAIQGEKLFKATKKFNETVYILVDIAKNGLQEYISNVCNISKEAYEKTKEMYKSQESCKGGFIMDHIFAWILKMLNAIRTDSCALAASQPINTSKLEETGFKHWTQSFLPSKSFLVIRKRAMFNMYNPMQIYLVFENPSKKLIPTILSYMLDLGGSTTTMALLHFLVTIYIMIILPLLLNDDVEKPSVYSQSKAISGRRSLTK